MAYFNPIYLKQPANYAKLLNKTRRHLLKKIQTLRAWRQKDDLLPVIQKIESLYEITCSMHLLKLRVHDAALFDICKREMHGIKKAILSQLLALAKNKKINETALFDEIGLFETLFSKTLQVIMPDPSIFLFFIQDLYAFNSVSNAFKQ